MIFQPDHARLKLLERIFLISDEVFRFAKRDLICCLRGKRAGSIAGLLNGRSINKISHRKCGLNRIKGAAQSMIRARRDIGGSKGIGYPIGDGHCWIEYWLDWRQLTSIGYGRRVICKVASIAREKSGLVGRREWISR